MEKKVRILISFLSCMILGLALSGCEKRDAAKSKEEPGTEEGSTMAVKVQWLGHASFRISYEDTVIYIDPWKLDGPARDATVVLISHSHGDHYSPADIVKISDANTILIASADVVEKEGKGKVISPGQVLEAGGIRIEGVAAYNPDKRFHPKTNNWVGFIVNVGTKRIYYAGDTDLTDELKSIREIDLALLPVGGKYTMNAQEASIAVESIKPKQAIPYHWGDVIGSRSDADRFARDAECEVTVLTPGESVEL